MWDKERTRPLQEVLEAQRRGDGGSKMRDEGQVWGDMEKMRVHGGEEERREVKAKGVGGGEQTGK